MILYNSLSIVIVTFWLTEDGFLQAENTKFFNCILLYAAVELSNTCQRCTSLSDQNYVSKELIKL